MAEMVSIMASDSSILNQEGLDKDRRIDRIYGRVLRKGLQIDDVSIIDIPIC